MGEGFLEVGRGDVREEGLGEGRGEVALVVGAWTACIPPESLLFSVGFVCVGRGVGRGAGRLDEGRGEVFVEGCSEGFVVDSNIGAWLCDITMVSFCVLFV